MVEQSLSDTTLPLTPGDYLELQNPREEASYNQFYKDLDCEKLLHVYEYTNGAIYGRILQNTAGLDEFNASQERVDSVRKSKLKNPSFKKITRELPTRDSYSNISHQTLEKLGFYNINEDKTKTRTLPKTYLRPELVKDKLTCGKLTVNSTTFQTYYDMDETDRNFLNWMNDVVDESKKKLSMDQFEIIISFIESKLYHVLRVLPPTIKNRTVIDYQQQQLALLYGSDDGTGCATQDDQACAVCNISYCDSTNSIVFCDGCDIAVHQDCYGVSFIPEGPWLCRRCLIARNVKEPCLFCPSTTGAFKQTDSGDWAHVLCALWTPELYFANPIYMEPVEGVSSIPKSRWRLLCYICKQKVGACIQCSKSSCFAAYHVTCAKRAGLFMKYKKGIKKAINDKSSMISYCDKHTPIDWGMQHDINSGIEKTRLYFHLKCRKGTDTDHYDSNQSFVTKEEEIELKNSGSAKFKWRLDNNVFVVPNIILKQLEQFFSDNKLPQISYDVLCQVSKYYTLKRQYLGKPLIKHPDVLNHASLAESTLDSRKEAIECFAKDVGSLQELGKMTLKRSRLENELNASKLDSAEMIHDPKSYIFKNLLSFFIHHFEEDPQSYSVSSMPKYAVKPTIYQIIDKIEMNYYADVESLISDIEKFAAWLISLELKTNSPMVPLQKLFRVWQRYKKAKYVTATEQFQHIGEFSKQELELITGEGLEFRIPPSTEEMRVSKKSRKKNSTRRLGIDITQYNNQESNTTGRNLRARRTASPNVEETSKKLRARLNRVKERTSIKNVRLIQGRRRQNN